MKSIIVLVAFIAIASAYQKPSVPGYKDHRSSNVKQESNQKLDIHPDGHYSYEYNTDDGAHASEHGVGGQGVQGEFQYTSPEGQQIRLTYVADENGYQPTGEHLPVAPEVPQQIAKALEYLRTHPSQEEEQYQAVPFRRLPTSSAH